MADLKALARRIQQTQPEKFTAPVLANPAQVWTVQNHVPFRWNVRLEPGWYEFTPQSGRLTQMSAQTSQRLTYLAALPLVRVIAARAVGPSAWMVFPFSAADVAQRGWQNGEPRVVHLVNQNVRPLDVLLARKGAGGLIFESLEDRIRIETHPARAWLATGALAAGFVGRISQEARNALNVLAAEETAALERQRQAEAAQRQAEIARQRAAQRQTVAGRFQEALEFSGAHLERVSQTVGDNYEVTWSHVGEDGRTRVYTQRVNAAGGMVSFGICMNGTDRQHTLESAVFAMKEAERLHRHDVPRENWVGAGQADLNDDGYEDEDD